MDCLVVMAPTLKQYLKEPNRLYRRVRDTQDKLHLSRAASQYHPGRGVYRSSFANAKRLVGTETNIAYRTADHERMQRLDFVVGIKIELSNNHTTKGPKGLPIPLTDICDELQGKYPKDFKFTGWHPNCRCHAKSILLTPAELDEMLKAGARGKEYGVKESSNYINKSYTRGVKKFNTWIEKNRERAKGWSTMPYFVRDNPHYVANFRVNTYSASERKFTQAHHTSSAMTQSLTVYLQKKYPDIPNTEKAAICDYTRGDVSDFRHLNKELMNDSLSEFSAAFSELLSNALSRLPTVETTVYRTIRLNRTGLENWKQQAEAQAVTTFRGFTSTSDSLNAVLAMMRRKGARKKSNETDVLLVIKGKTGHRIEDFSKFKDQHELLFDKGVRLKFEGISDINGHLTFDLTEL